MTDHNRIVTGNHITDYSYIYTNATSGTPLIARCVTGLGPSSTDNNNALGGLYFNGSRIPNGNCNASASVQANGALISNFVGVINLLQCGAFSTDGEGVYTCRMMDSLRIYQSMRLGIYFAGRSGLFMCVYIRMYMYVFFCIIMLYKLSCIIIYVRMTIKC